jgi:hypothetical protein
MIRPQVSMYLLADASYLKHNVKCHMRTAYSLVYSELIFYSLSGTLYYFNSQSPALLAIQTWKYRRNREQRSF